MAELDLAIRLAEKVLDDATRDPDSDLSMLSRQFLRSREEINRLRAGLQQIAEYKAPGDATPYAWEVRSLANAILTKTAKEGK